VVVTARRGKVWMLIQPPFTWEAISEPGMVDERIRTLALAAEDAKKMASGRSVSRGGRFPRLPGHVLDCFPKLLRSGSAVSVGCSYYRAPQRLRPQGRGYYRCLLHVRRTRNLTRLLGFRLLGSDMSLIGGTGMCR